MYIYVYIGGWCGNVQGGSVGTTLGIGTLLPPPLMPGVCRHGNSRVAPIEVTHTCKLGPRAHGSRYMPSRESGVSCIHCIHRTLPRYHRPRATTLYDLRLRLMRKNPAQPFQPLTPFLLTIRALLPITTVIRLIDEKF